MFKPLFHRNASYEWKLSVIRRSKQSCFTEKQVISKTVEVKKSLQVACEHSYYQKLAHRTSLYKVTLLKYFHLRLDRKNKIPKWRSDGCGPFWSRNLQAVWPHTAQLASLSWVPLRGCRNELLRIVACHRVPANRFLSLASLRLPSLSKN